MVKSRPRKNQSERSDLPCHMIILDISFPCESLLELPVIAENLIKGYVLSSSSSYPAPSPKKKQVRKETTWRNIETGYVLLKIVIKSNTSVSLDVFSKSQASNFSVVFEYTTRSICSSSLMLIWKILRQFTLATCRLIGHQLLFV